jgi:hypothetical protein
VQVGNSLPTVGAPHFYPDIRTLRAKWRELETELRTLLNGHEGGNSGYGQASVLRATAPALDPTGIPNKGFDPEAEPQGPKQKSPYWTSRTGIDAI